MSILANRETRLIVQGITGNEGLFHSEQMLQYNTILLLGLHQVRVGVGR